MDRVNSRHSGATSRAVRGTPRRGESGPPPPESVDARWLLKALGLTALAGLVCAYLAVCALVAHGAWQLFVHPGKAVTQTPANAALPFSAVRFDATSTGVPRLTGWWVPASVQPEAAPTLLLVHDGSGTLSDTLPRLELLHAAGVNIFAFDFRGFGASAAGPPTEDAMEEDTEAALTYLTDSRHLDAGQIVPVGVGLGASLAAHLAAQHPQLPALVVDNPDPDATLRPIRASRANLLPMHLLVGDHFDVAHELASVRQPKLLIAGGLPASAGSSPSSVQQLFRQTSSPKLTVTLPAGSAQTQYIYALQRFLGDSLRVPAH